MSHPERIWLVDAVEGGGVIGWTDEKPLDLNEPGVEYVRRDVVQPDIDLCNRLALLAGLPPEWRDDLLQFVEIMAEKLRANTHKGHWEFLPFSYLARRMGEEIVEFKTAMRDALPIEVSKEAADVANFAMMIATNALRCEQVEGGAQC